MAASTDTGWFNGAVWQRSGAGAYYTHLRGGQSWLADKYLYFLSASWRVGTDISSTSVYAYNQNSGQSATSPELQTSGGWVRWDGSAWADIDLVISCGERPLPFANTALFRIVLAQWGADRAATEATYGHISTWNVSRVDDLSNLLSFIGNSTFNEDLNGWDVGRVTSMMNAFQRSSAFNSPLNSWDVSKVRSMLSTFSRADAFNQPLDAWDTSAVTSMSSMFAFAIAFDKPINSWDVSSVTSMMSMFYQIPSGLSGVGSFNQDLNSWDTQSVQNTYNMFSGAQRFNGRVGNWNVSAVTYFRSMFGGAASFNRPLDGWHTTSAISMAEMFSMSGFNQPVDHFDVSRVTTMAEMFSAATAFDQPIDNWQLFPDVRGHASPHSPAARTHPMRLLALLPHT